MGPAPVSSVLLGMMASPEDSHKPGMDWFPHPCFPAAGFTAPVSMPVMLDAGIGHCTSGRAKFWPGCVPLCVSQAEFQMWRLSFHLLYRLPFRCCLGKAGKEEIVHPQGCLLSQGEALMSWCAQYL